MVPWSECRYRLPDPAPNADAILVLSGGLLDRVPPRQTIEVADAGDRVLYAAHLFKQQKAGLVICTGGVEWTTGPQDLGTTGPRGWEEETVSVESVKSVVTFWTARRFPSSVWAPAARRKSEARISEPESPKTANDENLNRPRDFSPGCFNRWTHRRLRMRAAKPGDVWI